ncbi:hypothetical protein ISN45_Aa01g008200 [Arabidopsis thaliana x Arabidopsis arenosa]|uniref:Disease resistance protein winged helix domain-containing protein n=1 Tax=Arabidopsis thaliana x Arabidopsis arenosa TaxID=1240361 RepID=A0A8T2BWQ3_9BRAS|nr:hypothetical protein ISN45_Aa01g008200 [Arabidopsis thaliana x Arabidopsis arenosa]
MLSSKSREQIRSEQDESWELFQKQLGEFTLSSHPDIPALALNAIGKTMAQKKAIQEWSHAITALNFPSEEFLLDYEIEKNELIEYWLCEGFIDGNRDEDGVNKEGLDIINLLVSAHLLINGGVMNGTSERFAV